ncbi:LysR family transcriptional regulator [Kribbella italica]|uniref:DNA-binding transcriptional LysR family regulator n=1 Tax=Kribbella italica TaxID=1540520 RepID=A0A7W9J457_9ACTN|nr:LysR family transcriptional regulator [Kribbella italica]MBB5835271.1 DNA-binding transcriptional LysR family regulator [Kribbella italica]
MLDVRRLRLLRDLAQLGTITAVADAHTYTPSAVSQQLTVLEREAGTRLLERTGRRVTLTPAGERLVQHAEKILAALEEAQADLATTELTGPLRIGAFPTAVRALLPSTLVRLARDHPRLDLTVTELDPAGAPRELRERRLDVALVNDYDVMPAVEAGETQPLLDETVYLAVHGAERSVADAEGSPWIAGTPGTACHAVTLHVCRAAGYTPRIRHTADDFDAVLALVAAGQGVSLVPQLAAGSPPDGVTLVPLAIRRRTSVAYRGGAARHPAIAAFVAAVRDAATAY